MVDMKKETAIPIWAGCAPEIAEAIEEFQLRWHPYSQRSKHYSIIRLIGELIDPAVEAYLNTVPAGYTDFVPGAGTGVGFSAITRTVGLKAMARVQRQLLRQFIATVDEQTPSDQRFIATIESLIGLVWLCALKQPKKAPSNSRFNKNRLRRSPNGFCQFCGNRTELAEFLNSSNPFIEDDPNETSPVLLSHLYCSKHRPQFQNKDWNPDYKKAKRSLEHFEIELKRLSIQAANRGRLIYQSDDPLIDSYIYHYVIQHQLWPEDEAKLRHHARHMSDLKITDQKKKMIILRRQGHSQAEIAKLIGLTSRQAVSKALSSVPIELQELPIKETISPSLTRDAVK